MAQQTSTCSEFELVQRYNLQEAILIKVAKPLSDFLPILTDSLDGVNSRVRGNQGEHCQIKAKWS